QRHDAVAGVLIDGALVPVNAVSEDPKQSIEETMPFLGVDLLGELHRARDIGKENGNGLPLTLERALVGEDLLGKVMGRIGTGVLGVSREVRAAVVAESRAGGVVVSAGSASHRGSISS